MAQPQPKLAMRRTTRNALVAAVFFILAPTLIVLDHRCGQSLRKTIERTTYAAGDRKTYHGQTFTVLDVVDGDTIDIDHPDGDMSYTRVRLLGVDTPETRHPTTGVMYFGPEASEFTAQRIGDQPVTLFLDTVGDHRGYYGRLLAYVRLADGTVLNEELIRRGLGYAYLSFPHSHFDPYAELMQTAIDTRTGLWKMASRDDLPRWLRQKRPDLLRYPPKSSGDGADFKNGEK